MTDATMRTYLEAERQRARLVPRPVYRFSTDRYECPFCAFSSIDYAPVNVHLKTCPARK